MFLDVDDEKLQELYRNFGLSFLDMSRLKPDDFVIHSDRNDLALIPERAVPDLTRILQREGSRTYPRTLTVAEVEPFDIVERPRATGDEADPVSAGASSFMIMSYSGVLAMASNDEGKWKNLAVIVDFPSVYPFNFSAFPKVSEQMRVAGESFRSLRRGNNVFFSVTPGKGDKFEPYVARLPAAKFNWFFKSAGLQ